MSRVFRPPLWLRIGSAVPLAALTVLLVIGGLAQGGAFAVLGPLAGLLTAFVTARWLVLRVEALPDRLVVVNYVRRVEIPWSDVGRVISDGGVVVHRRSGKSVSVAAFAHSPGQLASVDRRNAEVADELAEIARRRKDEGRGRRER